MNRRVLFLLLLAVSNVPLLLGQEDTLRVQTLTYDSITTRRGWWMFPDDTHTYRKVLMHHTLKCDAQTTQDQYACGEWDYLTYNQIHQHTGVLDSASLTHPFFLVGTAAPDSAHTIDVQSYNLRQRWERTATVVAVTSETLATVGTNETTDANSFMGYLGRSQYLYTATELTAAGLVAGPIKALRFNLVSPGNPFYPRCILRLKNTASTSLTAFEEAGLTTVRDAYLPPDGLDLLLTEAFAWDGVSNLLLEIGEDGEDDSFPAVVEASLAAPGNAVQELGADNAIGTNDDFVGVDAGSLAGLSNAVTITFRAFGAPDLPLNTTLLEAVGANGERLLNIHLPWSDGRVYWDAGNDGGGFDRIDKAGASAEYEGQWNNWAFVKNTTTGSMKIYLNGMLWHSGTGKTKPLSGIVRMRLASDVNGGSPYPGLIDGVNIFATELSAATIATWNDRKVTSAHPDFAALLQSFEMDEMLPWLPNAVNPDEMGWLMGTVRRVLSSPYDLHRNPVDPGTRPVVTFVQGDHEIALDSAITAYPTMEPLPLLTREIFAVQGNTTVPVDTVFAYSAGWRYTFDPEGVAIDSVHTGGALHYNDTLDYYGVPFEVVNNFEIGRYITPYGIGLSLGPQGFRWTFDVTDYQWLLHDSVELSAGNQQELIDLEFELIEGVPPRTVVDHKRPWGGLVSHSYANLDNDVALPAVTVDLDPAASQWSLRTRLTGHGHNSNNGEYPHCCEWKDNTHYLNVNGTQVDAWHIWQTNDCALNAVYPQGGTWPGSREGWCPGDVVKDHSVELTSFVSGNTVTLDYDITPVPVSNQSMGGGNYVMNMDLFEYAAPSFAIDAEILEVERPSKADYYRRDNPICFDPLVVLRNAGGQDLTSVTFTYSVSGGTPLTYTWTGSLKHMQTAEVVLPVSSAGFWVGDAEHIFTATVSAPNGAADQHAANDSYRTSFDLPVVYNHDVILHYKTNYRPSENSVSVKDVTGAVIFSRSSHAANTQYIDTLHLADGCYTFEMLDTGNDGLSYWADTDAGTGYCRLKKPNGVFVKNFLPEFGRSLHWSFTVGYAVGLEEPEAAVVLGAYPNPTTGNFTLTVGGILGDVRLDVFDASGRLVMHRDVELYGNDRIHIDLSNEADGLYQVSLSTGTQRTLVRIVKE